MMGKRKPDGRPLRIGITIGLNSASESLWVNGIKQNAIFLAMTLRASNRGHDVCLANTTAIAVDGFASTCGGDIPVLQVDDILDSVDVLIELGGQIGPAQTQRLKDAGGRLVSYCCGSEYVQFMEAIIFRRHIGGAPFINQMYDGLWVVPQNVETTRHFFQTLRRTEASKVPFVWHPACIEARTAGLPGGGVWEHRGGPRRLAVLEPNIDVLKFCLYPILIAEEAYRRVPQSIGFLHVANADNFVHDDKEFAGIMRHLDIVRDGKASFIGRIDIPEFLGLHTDVVISHQWGLPLNYMYLEAAWQGYPLVHNAGLIPEIGYFYPGNDVATATSRLIQALSIGEGDAIAYRNRQRAQITQRFLATNEWIVAEYDRLLDCLLAKEIRR